MREPHDMVHPGPDSHCKLRGVLRLRPPTPILQGSGPRVLRVKTRRLPPTHRQNQRASYEAGDHVGYARWLRWGLSGGHLLASVEDKRARQDRCASGHPSNQGDHLDGIRRLTRRLESNQRQRIDRAVAIEFGGSSYLRRISRLRSSAGCLVTPSRAVGTEPELAATQPCAARRLLRKPCAAHNSVS